MSSMNLHTENSLSPVTNFTVYQTATAIILEGGCKDYNTVSRIMSTSRSYEIAQGFAQLAAKLHNLPLIDYTILPHSQNEL
ncbi:MAG TPA: hypothetical protein V6C65_35325 [Allocoleopsis sp.]